MPDAPTTTEVATETEGTLSENPSSSSTPSTDGVDWKAKAREWEKRAKDNKTAADKLLELEEASKSDNQKAADRAAKAESDAAEARMDSLRYRAAVKHGITEESFDLLGSGDEGEINERAERLGKLLSAAKENEELKAQVQQLTSGKPVPATGRPVEQLQPGATPQVIPTGAVDDSYPAHWLPPKAKARQARSGQSD